MYKMCYTRLYTFINIVQTFLIILIVLLHLCKRADFCCVFMQNCNESQTKLLTSQSSYLILSVNFQSIFIGCEYMKCAWSCFYTVNSALDWMGFWVSSLSLALSDLPLMVEEKGSRATVITLAFLISISTAALIPLSPTPMDSTGTKLGRYLACHGSMYI